MGASRAKNMKAVLMKWRQPCIDLVHRVTGRGLMADVES